MPGLFSFMQYPRVRQSSSSSSPQPPRAQTAENQAGPAQMAPAQGTATRQGQASGNAGQSALDADRELQQALEASELEEALAQSRLAAEKQLYSDGFEPAPAPFSALDDEQLREAMALSEAEAKKADKGKGIMKRTPTEEDIERALQESAKLASKAPKCEPQHYSSTAPHQASSHSQTDQDTVDADLAQALYESQQLASSSAGPSFPSLSASGLHPQQTGSSRSRSAPMMPSPAAAAHAQHAPLPVSSQPPSRLAQAQPAHQQPQAFTSAPSQQAATGSVSNAEIYRPGSKSSSQAASPSQSSQLQPPRHQSASRQQGQPVPQYPVQTRQQLPPERQHQQGASPSHAGGLYVDGYHGSANLESILSADEAFARALQDEEFQTATANQVHQARPLAQPQQNPSPRQQQQHQQQQQQANPPQAPASQHSLGVQSVAPVDKPGMCAGCGRSLSFLGFSGGTVTAKGRTWHASCMKCGACQQLIPAGAKLGMGKEDHLPYHLSCYCNKFNPRCMVCHDLLPCGQDNVIRFNVSSFWKDKTCPKHQDDGTLQCCSCSRRCPQGEQWVEELDGRIVCLDCLSTIVRDTADAQPLYNQILSFYQRMGMALPEKPPLMMVESSALNDAEEREGRSGGGHSHGPVFHTRGLTLTVEYSAIQQVVTRDGRRLTQPVDLSSRHRFEVTAILVLYGLPWLLTGTILAHECMHAWLRLRGITRLPLQTEEGLCQLMGLLFLESQDLSKQQVTSTNKHLIYPCSRHSSA
ncbi:TPA: hypothetical protein ACH3X1_013844 [Trebouxia sp. C0004]